MSQYCDNPKPSRQRNKLLLNRRPISMGKMKNFQKLMDNNQNPFSLFLQKQNAEAKKENAHERDTIYHQYHNTLLLNEIKVKVVDQLKQKTFSIGREVLRKYMKYFDTVELDKAQIKIKCDTDIFEWLVKYIYLMEQ